MGEFQNGLFGCFSNCGVCIITYFVPCLTAGQTAEKVGESCCLYGFLSILGPIGIWSRAKIRGKVREQKGIDVSAFVFTYNFTCTPTYYLQYLCKEYVVCLQKSSSFRTLLKTITESDR